MTIDPTELQAAMDTHIRRELAPGLVACVRDRNGTDVVTTGTLAFDSPASMERSTIFRIASITKPITAALALTMVQDGLVALDESVERLLPELADRRVLKALDGPLGDTVPATRAITTRDLLTFKVGFGLVWGPQDALPIQREAARLELAAFGPALPRTMPPPDEWVRRFATLPLMSEPGEIWRYNTGAEIMGVLLARAGKKPLDVLLQERVLEPLGMKDTAFFVPEAKVNRFATAYVAMKPGKPELADEARGGAWSRPPAFPSAASGLVSTVDDLLAFTTMLFGPDESVLKADSKKEILRDHVSLEEKARSEGSLDPGFWKTHGWGLGIAQATDDPIVGNGWGWDGGAGTSWWHDPATQRTGILLTQRSAYPPMNPLYVDFWKFARG